MKPLTRSLSLVCPSDTTSLQWLDRKWQALKGQQQQQQWLADQPVASFNASEIEICGSPGNCCNCKSSSRSAQGSLEMGRQTDRQTDRQTGKQTHSLARYIDLLCAPFYQLSSCSLFIFIFIFISISISLPYCRSRQRKSDVQSRTN